MEIKSLLDENYRLSVEQNSSFNLRDFLFKYIINYWYLFFISLVISCLGVWLYLRYTIPKYETKSTLLIKTGQGDGMSNGEEFVFQDLGIGGNIKNLENEIQILKSRTIMLGVVRNLRINIRYFTEGRVLTNEIYKDSTVYIDSLALENPHSSILFTLIVNDKNSFKLFRGESFVGQYDFGKLFSNRYGSFLIRKNFKEIPNRNFIIRYDPPEQLALIYSNRLNISSLGNYSSVLELSLKDPIPQKGVDILNNLVSVYNEANIEDKNRVANNTLKFIEERIDLISNELETVESSVASFKRQNEIPTEVTSKIDVLLEEFQFNDRVLTELYVQKELLNSIISFLNSTVDEDRLIPLGSELTDAGLSNLIASYNENILLKERLSKAAEVDNPVFQNLIQEMTNQKAVIIKSIENAQIDSDNKIEMFENRNHINRTNLNSIPNIEKGLLEIKRQQSIKESLYLYLLQKREETAISLVVTVPNSRIIDSAINLRSNPVSPKEQNVYAIAFLLGISLPFGLIYLITQLNDKIISEDFIENKLSTPIIGRIYQNTTEKPIVVNSSNRSIIAEMFRLLRANLQFYTPDQEKKVIMVTSTVSGEGKTFTTVNLGASIALSNKKTIILGLDLRKPKLSQYFDDQKPNHGISTYIVSGVNIDDIIQKSDFNENLFFINSGPVPPNPSELLLHPRMDVLIDRLKESFDYILFDTPPVGLVADALLLNKFVTSTLYVIRYGFTKERMLSIIRNIEDEKKLKNISIVFNSVKKTFSNNYDYGYYYEKREGKDFWRILKRN